MPRWTPDEWAAIAQVVAALASLAVVVMTFFAVKATRDTVAEMRIAREQQQVPYVVAYLEPGRWGIMVTIENTGTSPAYRVKARYADPANSVPEMPGPSISDLEFLPASAKSRRHLFHRTLGTRAEDYPPVEVVCEWEDTKGVSGSARSFLDYRSIAEEPSGGTLHDVTDAIRNIERALERVLSRR